jgi:hypothetical protein
MVLLPLCGYDFYFRSWLYFEDELLDYLGLGPFPVRVSRGTPHHPIQIWRIHEIRVEQPESLKTHMRQLLCDMRSTAAKP